MNLQQNLAKYAELLLKVGLGIRPGDNLLIRMDEHSLPLVREIARLAYQMGVLHIHTAFDDDQMTLSRFQLAPDTAFDAIPGFYADFTEQAYLHNFHRLSLLAPNPELLKSVEAGRISRWQKTTSLANEHLMKYVMDNKVKWCVASVPSPAWAASVFPDLPQEEAINTLWGYIFQATRVDQPDPVAAWAAHEQALVAHQDYLNEQAFEKLLFKGPGTDLEVYLPTGHRWMGGSSKLPRGDVFMPNIPTEEVFTMPHAGKVNGTLTATKPLSTRGRIIEGMRFTFQDGAVVDFDATSGKDILQDMLDTDAGARRLGEVALVADDSPISNTGLLFKNTLFDENASCHFALGNSYAESIIGGAEMTKEERFELGGNHSMTHVDFMVGGSELDVVGYKKDGTEVPVLHKGEWAVDL